MYVVLLELVALLGAGVYVYEKLGQPGKKEIKRKFNKYVGGSTVRHLEEVDRVLFGEFIPNPCNTQYFEARWHDVVIPCANDLTKAIRLVKMRSTPPVKVRASCSICKEGKAYVHRWMFCCDVEGAVNVMNKMIESVQTAYFERGY